MRHSGVRRLCLTLAVWATGACTASSEHGRPSSSGSDTRAHSLSRLVARPFGDSIPDLLRTEVTGQFRGVYVDGFETSHFLHCDDGATGVAGLAAPGIDVMMFGRGATSLSRSVAVGMINQQPLAALDSAHVPLDGLRLRVFYVEWQGTLRGPEIRYPSGDVRYLLRVDSVSTARALRPSDCPRINQYARTIPFHVDTAAVIAAAWPAARRHLVSPRVGVLSLTPHMDTWSVPVSAGVTTALRVLQVPAVQPARQYGSVDTAWTYVAVLAAISNQRVRVILESSWFESNESASPQPFGNFAVHVTRSDTVDIACTPRYCW